MKKKHIRDSVELDVGVSDHHGKHTEDELSVENTNHLGAEESASLTLNMSNNLDEDPLSTDKADRRVIAPPLKRQGHVVIDTCAPSGNLERLTIAKSTGSAYKMARKCYWHDIWTGGTGRGKVVVRDTKRLVVEEDDEENDEEKGKTRRDQPYARKRVGEIDYSLVTMKISS